MIERAMRSYVGLWLIFELRTYQDDKERYHDSTVGIRFISRRNHETFTLTLPAIGYRWERANATNPRLSSPYQRPPGDALGGDHDETLVCASHQGCNCRTELSLSFVRRIMASHGSASSPERPVQTVEMTGHARVRSNTELNRGWLARLVALIAVL
jgi:hypothetical protein